MCHSMLIQGYPTYGVFESINPYKYQNSTITSMTVLFWSVEVIFNNVNSTNVVTNTNDKEVTIPPGCYTIGKIISMLNTMTNTVFSISGKASSYGCVWIQSSYSISFSNATHIREILGIDWRTAILPASFCGSNVIDITWHRQVIRVYSWLVRSSNLKIVNQDNNLLTTIIIDDPTTNDCRSVEDICMPMITRFDRLMFLFRDMEGNIMRLSGAKNSSWPMRTELKVKVKVLGFHFNEPFSMIELFGSEKKEVKLGNPFSFDQYSI